MSSNSLQPSSAKATPKRSRKSELPSSASTAKDDSTPAKRPRYDPHSADKSELLWDANLDEVLKTGLRVFPATMGKRTVVVDGHALARNGLIAEYILRRTGKVRTRNQVGSRVQYLKRNNPDNQAILALCTTTDPTDKETLKLIDSLDIEALLGSRHHTTLAAIAAAANSTPIAAAGLDPNVYLTRKGLLEQEIVVDLDAPRSSRRRGAGATASERGSSVAPSDGGAEDVFESKPRPSTRKEKEEEDQEEPTPKKRSARAHTRTPRKSSGLAAAEGTPVRRSARKSAVPPLPTAETIPPVPVLVVQATRQPAVNDDTMDTEEGEDGEELIISEEVRIGTTLGDGQVIVVQERQEPQVGWLGKAKGAFWSLVGF